MPMAHDRSADLLGVRGGWPAGARSTATGDTRANGGVSSRAEVVQRARRTPKLICSDCGATLNDTYARIHSTGPTGWACRSARRCAANIAAALRRAQDLELLLFGFATPRRVGTAVLVGRAVAVIEQEVLGRPELERLRVTAAYAREEGGARYFYEARWS